MRNIGDWQFYIHFLNSLLTADSIVLVGDFCVVFVYSGTLGSADLVLPPEL